MDHDLLQKLLFNRLRFFIDYHQITKNVRLAERERLNKMVGDELLNCIANSTDIRPTNVASRLSEDALYAKYFRNEDSIDDELYRDNSSANSVSDEMKVEPNSGSDEERIVMQAGDLGFEQKVYAGPRQKPSKLPSSGPSLLKPVNASGQSLLKPMNQRKFDPCESDSVPITVVRPEIGLKKVQEIEEPKQVTQPAAISLSRMRLAEALCKAKDAKKVQPTQNRLQTKKPTPESVSAQPLTVTIKSDTPLSSSRSSDASSSGDVELLKNEENPNELGQEAFLRMFGLFTPAQTEYLMNRRPQRKKRLCTSTERGDFHYGHRFDLFEKQFANKRNMRQFLYSPPATRAKRRIGSNGTNAQPKEPVIIPKRAKGMKSNASSSSSLSSNGSNNASDRVCLTCYKRSK